MVGEDSRSTDLSVSGKKGHSTNYWLITFFLIFLLRTKLFSNASYSEKLHKNARNRTFVVQFAYLSIRPKKVFVFSNNF